jgi:IS1 family transposase/transposase-like protein
MVADLPFHEVLLLALLWLAVRLYWARLRGHAPTPSADHAPAKRAPRRATAPPPFAGLTQKPPCPACEPRPEPVDHPPPAPPSLITSKRGRPRVVDTYTQYCPEKTCAYYGWVGYSNIRANGHPAGGPWRQLQCLACKKYFLETHGTLFYGKRVPPELLVRVVAALAEGLGIRAAARVFEVDPNTVLAWLSEAAAQCAAFSRYLLHDLQIHQVQLDELCAWVSTGQPDQERAIETSEPCPRAPHWVWAAIDPVSKLLLALDVGGRTLEKAQRLVHQVRQVLAPGCLPLFLTDGLKEYGTALLTHFGHWVSIPRWRSLGPTPKPRWLPQPELLYAQVIKTYRRRRLVRMRHRVVFGTPAQVMPILAARGWHINTAFIERVNLTLRRHVAALGRRVLTLCKHEAGLQAQLHLYQTYHNFCLPHGSLRMPLAHPQPTNATGSAKRWRPCTPAMATGLTDHGWALREVLLFRVPPWPQP